MCTFSAQQDLSKEIVQKRQTVITELTASSCTLQATGNQTDSICKISFGRGSVRNPATMIHGSPFLGRRIISSDDCIISLPTPPRPQPAPHKANKMKNVKYTEFWGKGEEYKGGLSVLVCIEQWEELWEKNQESHFTCGCGVCSSALILRPQVCSFAKTSLCWKGLSYSYSSSGGSRTQK